MQVGIDVKCMHTNFGGRGIFSFGDIATYIFVYSLLNVILLVIVLVSVARP